MIKLHELRLENETFTLKEALINPAHIVSVRSGSMEKSGAHILGSERERELRLIGLISGPPLYVDESVEEIYARVSAIQG